MVDYHFKRCCWCGPVDTTIHHDDTAADLSVAALFMRAPRVNPDQITGLWCLAWRCPRCHRHSRTSPLDAHSMWVIYGRCKGRRLTVFYVPFHPEGWAPDAAVTITEGPFTAAQHLDFADELDAPGYCPLCELLPDPMAAHDTPLCEITEPAEEPRYGNT